MRAKLVLPLTILTLVIMILLLESPPGYSQQGKKGGKGQQGGFGGGKMDPGQMFDTWLAKGKGYIVISETMFGRQELEAFAKKVGITDDKITRDQYIRYSEMRDQIREELKASGALQTPGKKGGGFGGPPTEKKGGFGGPPTEKKGGFGGPPAEKGGGPPLGKKADEKTVDRGEALFRNYDRNGDSYLTEDEIRQTQNFKNDWQKWDADKDGKINLDEWLAYFKTRDQQPRPDEGKKKVDRPSASSSGGIEVITIEDLTRTDYWRAGKLPDGLPAWFKECDKNQDGQVALYEWRAAGKPIAEFLALDRNDDGLLTPDEVLRSLRDAAQANARSTGQQTASSTARPRGPAGPPAPGGNPPAKGKGKGKKG